MGLEGEYEHGSAHSAAPRRGSPSSGKRGAPVTSIDVPLAHKDALYVRSHYDTMTLAFSDAPAPREIVAIVALATRGRLHARLGGLKVGDIKGHDGLC